MYEQNFDLTPKYTKNNENHFAHQKCCIVAFTLNICFFLDVDIQPLVLSKNFDAEAVKLPGKKGETILKKLKKEKNLVKS